jgi:hypothetical protein
MENIILSVVGVVVLFTLAIITAKWNDKKEREAINTFSHKFTSPVKSDSPVILSETVTSGSGSSKSGPLGTLGKKPAVKKASKKKSEFPITDDNKKSDKSKPGAKRGRKPKKDKGNDLLLS